jgi:hypothetical protein
MKKFKIKTPVAFFIFNRPDTTAKVFEIIRQVKPPKLFIIADGARNNKLDDIEKVKQTRLIVENIDWKCEVLRNYSQENLGCKKRVSSGLDWVFDQVEEAIILEDDCLPDPSFFRFCQELLEYYRDDTRIMAISGDNFQFGRNKTPDSYYFSRYNHCWGWASWRRAWQYYDVEMKLWEKINTENLLNSILTNPFAVKYWERKFNQTHKGNINTWDYQWTFACWIQRGLTILPNVNLVSNIGFNIDGTHHKTTKSNPFANMKTESIEFPLKHPSFMIPYQKADDFTQKFMFGFLARSYRKLKNILGV